MGIDDRSLDYIAGEDKRRWLCRRYHEEVSVKYLSRKRLVISGVICLSGLLVFSLTRALMQEEGKSEVNPYQKDTSESIEKEFGLKFTEDHSLSYLPESSPLYKMADAVLDVDLITNEDFYVVVVDDGGPPWIYQQVSFKSYQIIAQNKPIHTLPTKAHYLLYQYLVPSERQLRIPKGKVRLFLNLHDSCAEEMGTVCADVVGYAANIPNQLTMH